MGFKASLAAVLGATALAGGAAAAPAPASQAAAGYLTVMGWYKDLGVQRDYTRVTAGVLKQYGYQGAIIGTPAVNLRVLEGDFAPRFMLFIQFPDDRAVKRFWWSDEYKAAKAIRTGQGHLDVAEVDGVPGSVPSRDSNAAYLVFFMHLTDNAKFMKEYAPFAPAVVARHGGKFLIRTGRDAIEGLEGDWPNSGMVLVEFPTQAALKGFWESDDYRRLSEVRKATGDWSVVEIAPMRR